MPAQVERDDGLFRALVSGCHVSNAAVVAGMSERTAYRRLADQIFRARLDDARQSLRESIVAKLADAGNDAISVLTELMHDSDVDSIRLKAAKTVLDALIGTQKASTINSNQNVASSAASVAIRV